MLPQPSSPPHRIFSIGSVGIGAWTTVSHARQLIFGRTCTTRLKWEGTYSSTSRSSAPIRPNLSPPQVGHTHGASWTIVSAGKWSGKGARVEGLRFFFDEAPVSVVSAASDSATPARASVSATPALCGLVSARP